MKPEEYARKQIRGISEAITAARNVYKTAEEIRELGSRKNLGPVSEEEDFSRDTFKYFDANDAQGQVEGLRLQILDLKRHLINIKVENDKALLNGEFLFVIDRKIAEIFMDHSLSRLKAVDGRVLEVMKSVIRELTELKDQLTEIAEELPETDK